MVDAFVPRLTVYRLALRSVPRVMPCVDGGEPQMPVLS